MLKSFDYKASKPALKADVKPFPFPEGFSVSKQV